MNRMVVNARVGSDGSLHLDIPLGRGKAGKEVRVTVEAVAPLAGKPMLRASDLLHSDLVGIWAERNDLGDSRDFARRLREQAQRRSREP